MLNLLKLRCIVPDLLPIGLAVLENASNKHYFIATSKFPRSPDIIGFGTVARLLHVFIFFFRLIEIDGIIIGRDDKLTIMITLSKSIHSRGDR